MSGTIIRTDLTTVNNGMLRDTFLEKNLLKSTEKEGEIHF